LVRVDVGRGHVDIGADEVGDLVDVAAAQSLELELGELLGVDRHPALAAAEGKVQRGALEGHPEGERLHLVDVHPRVKADAALRRPARVVVAHAIAGKGAQAAVIHPHGDRDLEHRLGQAQALERVLGDGGVAHGGIQAPARALEERAQASLRTRKRYFCAD